MPRTVLVACLLVTAAFAGCLADPADPARDEADPGTDADPTVIPWALVDCTALAAAVPVDAEAVEAHLPDGFRPWTPQETGLPPHPSADAVLTLEVWSCREGSGLEGERFDDVLFGAVETPTEPPEDLRDPDAGYTPFSWQMLVPDAPRRTLLQDAGVPALDGSADLSGFADTPAGTSFRAVWTVGEDTYTFTGTTHQPMDRGTVVEHEFTHADGGFALWAFTSPEDMVRTGSGTLEMSPGSIAATIVGGTTAEAFLLTGHPSFENGTITLPAANGGDA